MQKTRRNSRFSGCSARQVTFCGWRHVSGLLLSPSSLFATGGDETVRSLLSAGIPCQRGPYDTERTRTAPRCADASAGRRRITSAHRDLQIRRAHAGPTGPRTGSAYNARNRLYPGGFSLWSRLGSNQRPSACEADALPLSHGTERGKTLTRGAAANRIACPITEFALGPPPLDSFRLCFHIFHMRESVEFRG